MKNNKLFIEVFNQIAKHLAKHHFNMQIRHNSIWISHDRYLPVLTDWYKDVKDETLHNKLDHFLLHEKPHPFDFMMSLADLLYFTIKHEQLLMEILNKSSSIEELKLNLDLAGI